ncbi:MAG: hypothetical protein DWQ04_28750 [Chloroflexi bacterium]|nr:MAG: hypothetical protein DWQ04_28750 [Chloroflexota bacterium]
MVSPPVTVCSTQPAGGLGTQEGIAGIGVWVGVFVGVGVGVGGSSSDQSRSKPRKQPSEIISSA